MTKADKTLNLRKRQKSTITKGDAVVITAGNRHIKGLEGVFRGAAEYMNTTDCLPYSVEFSDKDAAARRGVSSKMDLYRNEFERKHKKSCHPIQGLE